ncbi:MAG: HD domain-containing phosphohydrolase [Pseudomonadota bacterium]
METECIPQKIPLSSLVAALSEALGLVGGKIVNHGKRVAYLALNLAGPLGLNETEIQDLWNAALLHDAGVSRTRTHEKLLQFDWEGAYEHCRDGANLLRTFPLFARPAEIILHHHSKWSELKSGDLPEKTALMANLVFLADRIDVLINWKQELILNRSRIEDRVKNLAGDFFNPDAVDAFLEKSAVEVFWLSLYPRHLSRSLTAFQPQEPIELDMKNLEDLARIFAQIVDNKSPFTRSHSEGVGRLCHFFARNLGFSPAAARKLMVAGLLHDLGKLAVPDEILEKPSQLTPDEFQIIKRHPFETYYILSGVPALNEIRDWASFHHEKMDGSGYPFHFKQSKFSLEHVIVMFSDIIQALIQDRPYRAGLSRDQVLDILLHLAAQQTVFAPLLKIVARDYELCANLANGRG